MQLKCRDPLHGLAQGRRAGLRPGDGTAPASSSSSGSRLARLGWAAVLLALVPAMPAAVHAADPITGAAVPECALEAMDAHDVRDLGRFRGKVLYVDFWASWCRPCVQTFPLLNDLERRYRGEGLQVVGINVDERAEDAAEFTARLRPEFALAADRRGDCPRRFDVRGMPSAYLVDRRGIVRYRHVGYRSEDAQTLRARVVELLAEPAP